MLVCGTWSWAAPRILRWGVLQDSRAERAKKNIPHFSKSGGGGTSKQISVGAYWIHWNLLSGCRIGRCRLESGSWNSVACTVQYWIKTVCCRSKDHFHWTAPPVPLYPAVPKSGETLSPTHTGCAAHVHDTIAIQHRTRRILLNYVTVKCNSESPRIKLWQVARKKFPSRMTSWPL